MRDLNRIKHFLKIMEQIWLKHPDTRFNQLLLNLQYEYAKENGEHMLRDTYTYRDKEKFLEYTGKYPDLYFVEDEDFLNFLKERL
jgi:hypothetical protein